MVVVDDGSQDARIAPYLKMLERRGFIKAVLEEAGPGPREARIGLRRKEAVDMALEKSYDFLLMLDDDIIVGEKTIRIAITDFKLLREKGLNPGAFSLHIPHSILTSYVVDGITFSEAGLGGEANVLLPRETMERFKDQWGPQDKGFGDLFFRAIRKAGYRYFERSNPPSEVQHVGIGVGASIIHRGKTRNPFWCNRLYESRYQGGPIRVKGFDQNAYNQALIAAGPEKAPIMYMRDHPRKEPCKKKRRHG